MSILALPAPPVKPALGRPAWTDADVYALGPDQADAQHWAEQNPDHHTTEETPVEVLGDGPDWDVLADDAATTDCYSRGFLPL